MSGLALMEVQRALYTKLAGDAVLMDMVSGIYDAVPQETAKPYVVIGDGQEKLLAAQNANLADCRLNLHVWTEAHGRKTALTILNRLHALLHLGTLTLSGFTLLSLRVEQASTALIEQGTAISGVLGILLSVAEEA